MILGLIDFYHFIILCNTKNEFWKISGIIIFYMRENYWQDFINCGFILVSKFLAGAIKILMMVRLLVGSWLWTKMCLIVILLRALLVLFLMLILHCKSPILVNTMSCWVLFMSYFDFLANMFKWLVELAMQIISWAYYGQLPRMVDRMYETEVGATSSIDFRPAFIDFRFLLLNFCTKSKSQVRFQIDLCGLILVWYWFSNRLNYFLEYIQIISYPIAYWLSSTIHR